MGRMISAYVLLLVISVSAQQQSSHRKQPSANATPASPSTASAQQIWADLMKGNERFIAGTPAAHDTVARRQKLADGQHPKVVVLACSDSRVAPELLFDQNLGDLFVIRTAGNIADSIGLGTIEYAVEHLGSSVLVVLGHTKCGAVTAACSKEKMPSSNLQALVDKIAPAVSRVNASTTGAELIEAAVKQNVHQSAQDVLANSAILRHAVDEGALTIFEAEYQLDTGRVIRLETGPGIH